MMDLECLVLKEILMNFPEMFKVLLCYFHLKKGMRKNCMAKVGKTLVEEDEDCNFCFSLVFRLFVWFYLLIKDGVKVIY